MTHVTATAHFVAFSGQHWLLLAVFAVGVVALPMWGSAHRGTPVELVFRRAFAVVLAAVFLGMQVYYQLEPGPFALGTALPLELCDLAVVAAVVALLTRNEVATAFAYYVALTLSVQGILTPALTQPFPTIRFFGFWALHLMVVWAAAYLTWGLGFRPTWRLYGIVCALTIAWAVAAYGLERAARHQLRLPQPQAGVRVVARPAGAVALVRRRGGGDRRGRLGRSC